MARYLLADDLTGACEGALAFAKRGVRARVWLNVRSAAEGATSGPHPEVVAIDLDSRSFASARAAERTAHALACLRPSEPREIVKKIDSTLRGNIASETIALLAAFPHARAIVAPSYPAQGRTMRGGALHEHGQRADAPALAEMFKTVRTVPLELATVRGGDAELARALAAFHAGEVRIALADAETDDDLRALVRAASAYDEIVWIGSAGIIDALAAETYGAPQPNDDSHAHGARALVFVGSRNPATREQLASVRGDAAVETIDARAILRNGAELHAAFARTARALDTRGVAVVAIGGELLVEDPALDSTFAAAAAALVRERPDLTIVISGGATARAFCEASGIVGLEVRDEVASGCVRSRAIGAPYSIVTKAGGFGSPRAFQEVLAAIHERSIV